MDFETPYFVKMLGPREFVTIANKMIGMWCLPSCCIKAKPQRASLTTHQMLVPHHKFH